jgi:hypothetical protein
MARMDSIILRGATGPLIFYEYRGKQVSRSRPERVKQTKATRAKALLFGKAVRISAALRIQLFKLVPESEVKPAMYALNTALLKWLATDERSARGLKSGLSYLEDLQFNQSTSMQIRVQAPFITDWSQPGKVTVEIPAMLVGGTRHTPANTVAFLWEIGIAGCAVDNPYQEIAHYATSVETAFEGKDIPAQIVELPFSLIPGGIHLVVIALKYIIDTKGKRGHRIEKQWLPVGVVGSCFKKG